MKTDKTYWNLTGLLVWIMHRDQIFADGEADYRGSAVEVGLITSNWLTGLDCIVDFEQAVSEVLSALVKGHLSAFASLNSMERHEISRSEGWISNKFDRCPNAPVNIPNRREGRVSIPPEGWIGREFNFSPDVAVEVLDSGVSKSRYENLLFSVEEAVSIWPPRQSLPEKKKKAQSVRDKSKAQTQLKYTRWRKRADALRQEFPGMGNVWYSRKISKEDIAEGATDSYIRKQIGGRSVKKP
ncbi:MULTISPECIES: hypothetical protein [unclassified Marinobacterium]|uniref:hypothetical protein n=1 Tax=unclassified Marinobacterium TaxID=2644139 RepID=UPI001569D365|nr:MULTISPECIES: hypothetical protein [unclassified Marinobacterium]NRP52383.1 hypothetical protein [Marinobacterium sp. xm-v-242]NRP76964.1 hypothetical protein [Marinobacterium sp. xm-m-383]